MEDQRYAFTPRVAADLVAAAKFPEAAPPPDPDSTCLTAQALLTRVRSLVGAARWDHVLSTFVGRERPSQDELTKEILRRAAGKQPLSPLRNLDSLNRDSASGRPRNIGALVDDLLGVAPPWPSFNGGH